MTPEQYVEHLDQLIAVHREADALAFAERFGPSLRSRLTADQFEQVSAAMHYAEMVVGLMQVEVQEAAPADRGVRASIESDH